ncbi:hypothetical protein IDH44_19315 [Paenibacillus sp. IB182496]|uniref:Uncharacterized protein n=1 Tax=Paenibacillus sabuli TaxID=2772509 RepID=A0A927BWU2_9BACL|nr:hypothetical protein [Paenibacillus sabuli]MBD2847356.1 hypothetical protein [Paenibacillus sabuli]
MNRPAHDGSTIPELVCSTPWTPPDWALHQRRLLRQLDEAAPEFVARYTHADGTLIWRADWPGMDGSDDPYEGFMNLSLLYALGGSEETGRLAERMWEAITWQWTQYGQIHDEFDGYYDWMHHGEGSLFFYFLGLSHPDSPKVRQRAVKFAELYMGEDPEAPNYDAERRLMRSPITGSRGPRFELTEEDWLTHRGVLDDYPPPFDDIPGTDPASGRCAWSDDAVYRAVIERMNERQTRGDVPVNLNATSLIANAYLHTRDPRYVAWVEAYVSAWEQRCADNGGIMPDNVGLSGRIGEYMEGKWWGGFYGWRWPHGLLTVIEPILNGCMNRVLLTGDRSALGLARQQLDMSWQLGRMEEGEWRVPFKHTDAGWTDYRVQVPTWPIYLWCVSMAEEDAARVRRIPLGAVYAEIEVPGQSGRNDATMKETKHYIANTVPWFRYMQGDYPDYPVRILEANWRLLQAQLAKMRAPEGDPLNWETDGYHIGALSSIHKWQEMCPLYFESLVQLMWGAPMHISHGGLQHGRVRYYDGQRRRPGLPADTAALVERLEDERVTLTLVNLSMGEERVVIVQSGVFGEHAWTRAERYDEQDVKVGETALSGRWFAVRLAPGAGVRLRLGMRRYCAQPSYETPWSAPAGAHGLLRGRQHPASRSCERGIPR